MAHFKKKRFLLHFGSGVAQLVDRSLPTPVVRGSNPVIGKLLYNTFVYKNKIKIGRE